MNVHASVFLIDSFITLFTHQCGFFGALIHSTVHSIAHSFIVPSSLSEKRRKTSEDQYKTIKAHVKKDDGGRIQAYGWSLPSSSSSLLTHSEAATPTRTLNHVTSAPVISQPETGPTAISKDEGSKPNGSEGIVVKCGGGGDGPDVSPCASSGQRGEVRRMGRGMLPVPVPIYCKPLHKADASVKVRQGLTKV